MHAPLLLQQDAQAAQQVGFPVAIEIRHLPHPSEPIQIVGKLTKPRKNRRLNDMKTTIDLPDEVFQQAQEQASQHGLDVNQFLSTAVTKMVQASQAQPPTPGGRRVEFPIIKARPGSSVITKEMVDRAEAQLLKEEAEYYGKFMRR